MSERIEMSPESMGMCLHGNFLDSCEQCKSDNIGEDPNNEQGLIQKARAENLDVAAPWTERIDLIRENSIRNLDETLKYHELPSVESLDESSRSEIEHIRETMRVTVNRQTSSIEQLFEDGRLRSSAEVPSKFARLFDSKLLKLIEDSTKFRWKAEERCEIRPSGNVEDPELIYGAITHDTEDDQNNGGAPQYGDSIIILKSDSVKDRATFSLNDSYGATSSHLVTWNEAPTLKLYRDTGDVNYVEAQIAGGVQLDDIEEIRFKVNSREEGEDTLSQLSQHITAHPEIEFSYLIIH